MSSDEHTLNTTHTLTIRTITRLVDPNHQTPPPSLSLSTPLPSLFFHTTFVLLFVFVLFYCFFSLYVRLPLWRIAISRLFIVLSIDRPQISPPHPPIAGSSSSPSLYRPSCCSLNASFSLSSSTRTASPRLGRPRRSLHSSDAHTVPTLLSLWRHRYRLW